MTLYIDLPTAVVSKREQLTGQFGAEILPAQPNGLDEVPAGKALVCVGDLGSYEAAGSAAYGHRVALVVIVSVYPAALLLAEDILRKRMI